MADLDYVTEAQAVALATATAARLDANQATAESAASAVDDLAALVFVVTHSQEYPPLSPSTGTGWEVPSVGHTAQWDGDEWQPVTPDEADINVACILGNEFVLLLDAEQNAGGSTTWANLGTGGSSLNATISGATYDTDHYEFDGTDDYAQINDNASLDFAAAESFTLLVVAAGTWDTVNRTIVGKRNAPANTSTSAGYTIATGPAVAGRISGRIADGSVVSSLAVRNDLADTDPHLFAFSRDVTADTLTMHVDGIAGTAVTDTTTGSLDTAQTFRIARFGTTYTAMSAWWVALARSALSVDQIRTIEMWRRTRWA